MQVQHGSAENKPESICYGPVYKHHQIDFWMFYAEKSSSKRVVIDELKGKIICEPQLRHGLLA